MSATDPLTPVLVGEILAEKGRLHFASMLQMGVKVATLRELARRHGITPKGGFRLEKAPARVLAPLLAEIREPHILGEVVEAFLLEMRQRGEEKAPEPAVAGPVVTPEQLARKEREIASLGRERDKARESAARLRDRLAQADRRLSVEVEAAARLRSEINALGHRIDQALEAVGQEDVDKEMVRRVRELEGDLVAHQEAEEGLRRLDALRLTRIRELEERAAELEELVPKSKRQRRKMMQAPAEPERRVVLPYLLPSFYKSLEGKERRSIDKAVHALFLFCTQGPAYPGLEVKQIGGQDLWSLRASLKLRVYFRMREDGDVDVVALADREDQDTALRRLKET